MPSLLLSTLTKVALPGLAISAMLFAAKKKKLSFAEDLGLRAPKPATAGLFLLLWVCLVALEEYLTRSIDGAQAKPWPEYPGYIVAMRVLAIGVLGPIGEELAFRGLLFTLLRRTPLKVAGAIVLTAALWAAIHLQYSPVLLALIFVDGVSLGLARHFSGSLYLAIAMHMLGNLFSIAQSIAQ